jgi:hypothetical protein
VAPRFPSNFSSSVQGFHSIKVGRAGGSKDVHIMVGKEDRHILSLSLSLFPLSFNLFGLVFSSIYGDKYAKYKKINKYDKWCKDYLFIFISAS